MKKLFGIVIILLYHIPTFSQSKVTDTNGTYTFNYVRSVDATDFTKIKSKSPQDISVDYYVNSYGWGKLFIFFDTGKQEFIIKSCELNENKNTLLMELVTVSENGDGIIIPAFIRFLDGDEEPAMFGLQYPNQEDVTMYVNIKSKS